MNPKNDLDRLALLHGSDKFGVHRYTRHYHRFFNELRESPIDLLEIGIGGYDDPASGGASLKMWRDYFTNGRIYGLDWYDKPHLQSARIAIFRGSQADPVILSDIITAAPTRSFDIIIDDGSHRGEHIVTTFLMMFPYVKPGGWYVVEDVETAYLPGYGGSADLENRFTSIGFFRGLVDTLNWRGRESGSTEYAPSDLELNVASVHFFRNLIFIGR